MASIAYFQKKKQNFYLQRADLYLPLISVTKINGKSNEAARGET